jgi:GT2 family glycosyltransferase
MSNWNKDAEIIRASGLFDERWYLKEYPDVADLGMSPIDHYLWLGATLERNPSPHFDTAYYLKKNPDVRRTKVNPLLHYAKQGVAEGRRTQGRRNDPYAFSSSDSVARMGEAAASPVIIIPVYNAVQDADACIRSVLRHRHNIGQLIVIDDASPDPAVRQKLAKYSSHPSVTILRNEQNEGFTRTINRGIEAAGQADVVLLNSDTVVTPRWLVNLRLAAYSGNKVATVTPFSDNAGAFSAPEIGVSNTLPDLVGIDQAAQLVTRNSCRLYPAVPTGNGFCMYVRRDCLDEVGLLDADAFPRGYGEENDFCMRAGRLGWINLIDDATYIHHVRSASFGDAKSPLIQAGRAVIDNRYPEYASKIRVFHSDPIVIKSRTRVRDAFASVNRLKARPRILFAIATRTGGTPQTNEDLMRSIAMRFETYVLQSDSRRVTLFEFTAGEYVEIDSAYLTDPIRAFPHSSGEYDDVVRDWLIRYNIELIHVRHLGWHGLGLINEAARLDTPIVLSFHDFYTVCPTVKLLDQSLKYCGGQCTPGPGACQMELWTTDEYPSLKHEAVLKWRQQFEPVLRQCDVFVTTSQETKDTIVSTFPFLSRATFPVIPHGRDFAEIHKPDTPLRPGEKLRVLIPGNISPAKGGAIVAELGRRSESLDIEIHVLGKVSKAIDMPQGVVMHGEYAREDFLEKVRAIRPHLGAIFSLWPETYCHTLTELWAAGLPVVGFNIGSVGERIRQTGAGWLVDDLDASAAALVLGSIARDKSKLSSIVPFVESAQAALREETVARMSEQYLSLYERFGSFGDQK